MIVDGSYEMPYSWCARFVPFQSQSAHIAILCNRCISDKAGGNLIDGRGHLGRCIRSVRQIGKILIMAPKQQSWV